MANVGLLIAGGSGNRMHQDIPKQFINVYDKPVLLYTLEGFQKHPQIDAIEVVCIDGWHDVLWAYAKQFDITKLKWVVSGGSTGQESIRNGVFNLEGKIDDNDITSKYNGSYLISNLTENHVITVTLSDAEETYQLCAYFYDSSAGTIYFKPAMAEKTERNCLRFPKESVVTLIVKAPIGHEVSKIHLSMSEVRNENGEVVSSRREEDAEIHYNPATKEYYCDITITARTDAGITTQKKPSDGTTEIAYTLDASGMATFCSEYDLDFSTEATKDIAAYVVGQDTTEEELQEKMKEYRNLLNRY